MEDLKNILEENGVMCKKITYSETLDKLVLTLKKDYIKREAIAIKIGLCILAVSTLCAGIGFGSGNDVLSAISFITMIASLFLIVLMILHTKRKCENRHEENECYEISWENHSITDMVELLTERCTLKQKSNDMSFLVPKDEDGKRIFSSQVKENSGTMLCIMPNRHSIMFSLIAYDSDNLQLCKVDKVFCS